MTVLERHEGTCSSVLPVIAGCGGVLVYFEKWCKSCKNKKWLQSVEGK